jgi:hypothetical protein
MKISDLDLNDVDTSAPENSDSFQSLPSGKYKVMISRADYRETSAGTGHRIPLELTVVGGDSNGRMLFEGLNVDNPNPVATQIGKQRLAEICDAIGLERDQFHDTDQIEGHMVVAHVSRTLIKDLVQREKYGDDAGMENNVSRFSSMKDSPNKKKATPRPIPELDGDAPF